MKCWPRAKEILSSPSTTNQGIEDTFYTIYYFSETKIYDYQRLFIIPSCYVINYKNMFNINLLICDNCYNLQKYFWIYARLVRGGGEGVADDAIEKYTWVVEMSCACGTIRYHPTIQFDISIKLSAPHTRLVSNIHCAWA